MELHSTLGLCLGEVRAFLVSLCDVFFATFLEKGSAVPTTNVGHCEE